MALFLLFVLVLFLFVHCYHPCFYSEKEKEEELTTREGGLKEIIETQDEGEFRLRNKAQKPNNSLFKLIPSVE